MAILTVGPSSAYITIKKAMAAAGPGDTVELEAGYKNESAKVLYNGMIIDGGAGSTGIQLQLVTGVTTVTLTGTAPIDVFDAADGNSIVGNDGDNVIHVSGGADTVSGAGGEDRLVVDYRQATGAITGDASSNFTEASGGGRMVTILGGFEHLTVLTGDGADTITTAGGDDLIRTGEGAGTINAGQGANRVISGSGADTITALDGGNFVDAGDGENTVTTGSGLDRIKTGIGADTIISGAGDDRIEVGGGSDTADAGAGRDRLVVDYSDALTAVTGGVTSGGVAGYAGHIADRDLAVLDFVGVEDFVILTGQGDDRLRTGSGDDEIHAGGGADQLRGGGGRDLLFGDSGNDQILAGSGKDSLFGGDGNDRLSGGKQQDSLTGGDGADVFVLAFSSDSLAGGKNRDVIRDFSRAQDDRIDLSGIDADTTQSGDQAFHLGAGATFSGLAGELIQRSNGQGSTIVSGDLDGDLVADFEIEILGGPNLINQDFLL
jgi:Ca2+-binding RTX toxin-like protein